MSAYGFTSDGKFLDQLVGGDEKDVATYLKTGCLARDGLDPSMIPDTGFVALDDYLDGGLPIGLTILAGRPGIGKTTFCNQAAFNVASAGKEVLFLSFEDNLREFTKKALARGDVAEDSQNEALNHIHFLDVPVDVRLDEIRNVIKDANELSGGVDLIIVDQLMHFGNSSETPRDLLVALHFLARELSCAALVSTGILREFYWNEIDFESFPDVDDIVDLPGVLLGMQPSNPTEDMGSLGPCENVAVRVIKNRFGPAGAEVHFTFDAEHSLFTESA